MTDGAVDGGGGLGERRAEPLRLACDEPSACCNSGGGSSVVVSTSSQDGWSVGASRTLRAFEDPVLIGDERVMKSMLEHEDKNVSTGCYLRYSKNDLKPYMRRVVVEWMLEVTDEQKCEETVLPLSVSLLDEVVAALPIKKTQLQLVAAVCMFIASKFKDTYPLCSNNLVVYTDRSISVDQLLDWEMLVLEALKWNVCRTTPFDLLDHILGRLGLAAEQHLNVRRHSLALITLCILDVQFASYPPSMVAAGSIFAAACGLLGRNSPDSRRLLSALHSITAVEKTCLKQFHEQIEEALRVAMLKSSASHEGSSVGVGGPALEEVKNQLVAAIQPSTPTDIRDIRISSDVIPVSSTKRV